ncbi:hypothetical protein SH1V18_43900 [Vallitalea longa]|uniref:Uncharacterized protein n=1 Tax=Vallitalea longa TaxID=2936439 RepID=A0A9W5YG69_9FIRM|nr:hypothetical protein [Vallitalea longa]GKX31910.1 hypothetical protein SH1V18_43900 [Vallitalea longa]
MKKSLINYLKDKNMYFYIEISAVVIILILLIAFFVPKQISKIDNYKRETDISNAVILGQAAENIINNNNDFKNYSVNNLNINKKVDINSDAVEDNFINLLIEELDGFDIKEIPHIKLKKGGYSHFSITIYKNKVYVYVSNGDNTNNLQLYPEQVDKITKE